MTIYNECDTITLKLDNGSTYELIKKSNNNGEIYTL